MTLCTPSRGLPRPTVIAVLLGLAGIFAATWCAADTGPLNYALYLQSFDPAQPNASTVKQADVLPGGLKTDITNAWNGYLALAKPRILQTVQQANAGQTGLRITITGTNLREDTQVTINGNAVVSQYDISPMVEIYATTQGRDLGGVSSDIRATIARNSAAKPKGAIVVNQRQHILQMEESLSFIAEPMRMPSRHRIHTKRAGSAPAL